MQDCKVQFAIAFLLRVLRVLRASVVKTCYTNAGKAMTLEADGDAGDADRYGDGGARGVSASTSFAIPRGRAPTEPGRGQGEVESRSEQPRGASKRGTKKARPMPMALRVRWPSGPELRQAASGVVALSNTVSGQPP
jgi:hypothetical protein